ncbi:MAG: methyl-accepting chemotaxis protein [Zetaproteobacteria bacterium]|nr:MAG: methyl-accepting chemotaxis protein [Zetaproteobacteria bacterium]
MFIFVKMVIMFGSLIGRCAGMLNRLTIRQRLLIPSAIVVFGFLAIYGVFERGLAIQNALEQEQRQANEFFDQARELERLMLLAQGQVRDFLLRSDMAAMDAHTRTLNRLHALADRLADQASDGTLGQYFADLHKKLSAYEETARSLVERKVALGLNENLGLLGALRRTIHAVEHTLDELDAIYLSHSMLMMRRHEKDFLARHKEKYIREMGEEHARFLKLLAAAKLPAAVRRDVRAKVDNYYQAFLELAKGEQALWREIVEMNMMIDGLNQSLDALMSHVRGEMRQHHLQFEQRKARVRGFIQLGLLVVALLVVVPLFLLGRDVNRSMQVLIARMRALLEGGTDLSRRLEVRGNDEIAALAGLVNGFMDRLEHLMGKIQQSGIRVASSVTDISAVAHEQEAMATEHAATTNQVATSVKEITTTSRQLGQSTAHVTELAHQAAEAAGDGKRKLAEVNAAMQQVTENARGIAEQLSVLNEKVSNINAMASTINKVADQTNLLSLNAAIEAEKAGEQGRGFAVVASEIRRLADQSAVAAYDIEQVVGEVRGAVSSGVMSMDRFAEQIREGMRQMDELGGELERIIGMVQELAPHIDEVNAGLQMQATGAAQIDDAMSGLSEAARQTAEVARQSSDAIHQLNAAVEELKEAAQLFRVQRAD